MRAADRHPRSFGPAPQAAGGGVAVHPGAPGAEQDRPAGASADGAFDGPAGRWRQRDQHDLGAFAAHTQHPVAVLFAEAGDVGAGGFEDPQAQQAGHRHQREITRVRRLPCCGEQRPGLQVGEPQGR
jgi:hypothetical protein